MKHLLAIVVVSTWAACSAPALNTDLSQAEQHEKAGRHDEALAAFGRAQTSCRRIENGQRRRINCSNAYLHRAELLENLGRKLDAAKAYQAVPAALPNDKPSGAQATYRAGRIYLTLRQDKLAYTLLWRTITDYPNEGFAGDALKIVLRDGRKRNAKQLYTVLWDLFQTTKKTRVGDNVLFAMARLAEDEFRDKRRALSHYDDLYSRYRLSGLYDDALWHGARLARAMGDSKGAAKRLRKLLDSREVSRGGIGSYFSIWLDNAQLLLGIVLRDDLKDVPGALAAFKLLPEHYPASVLRDDAIYETAVAWHLGKQPAKACKALAKLRKDWKDSRYELVKAPALRRKLGCTEVGSKAIVRPRR